MKNSVSPLRPITAAIATLDSIDSEIVAFERQQQAEQAERKTLEESGDINDDHVLDRIMRLQAKGNLAPRRLDALTDRRGAQERIIIETVNEIAVKIINPRARELMQLAKDRARADLGKHITVPWVLDEQVSKSAMVSSLIAAVVSITDAPVGGVRAYAAQAIAAWNHIEGSEAQLR